MLFVQELNPDQYQETFPKGLLPVKIDCQNLNALYTEATKRAQLLEKGEFRVVELVHPLRFEDTVTLTKTISSAEYQIKPNYSLVEELLEENDYSKENAILIPNGFKAIGRGTSTLHFPKQRIRFAVAYEELRYDNEAIKFFDTLDEAETYIIENKDEFVQTPLIQIEYSTFYEAGNRWEPIRHHAGFIKPLRRFEEYEISATVKVPLLKKPDTKLVIGNL